MLWQVVSAVADPSDSFDSVIQILEDRRAAMASKDVMKVSTDFLMLADSNQNGKVTCSVLELPASQCKQRISGIVLHTWRAMQSTAAIHSTAAVHSTAAMSITASYNIRSSVTNSKSRSEFTSRI